MQNFESPLQNSEKSQKIQDERFAQIEAWQNDDDYQKEAAERARRLVEAAPSDDDPGDDDTEAQDAAEQPRFTKRQITTAGVLAGAAAVGIGAGLALDANQPPEFSNTYHEYVIQPGDGLENAARDVTGSDKVDIREVEHYISVDPANIDVLKDGLQPGEQIEVPNSVNQ